MTYMDEKILAVLNEVEKSKQKQDICTGPVTIGDRSYEFEERDFFDHTLTMYVPKDFEEMPTSLRKLKYPHEQRPQIIQSDETGSIAITLNRIDQDLQDQWVKELTNGMKSLIQKANPANVFYTDGIEVVNEKQIGYFECKSPALDGFLYTVMFFFELAGKTVMGTFCCPYQEYPHWREIAFQIIRTVRVVQEEGEAG